MKQHARKPPETPAQQEEEWRREWEERNGFTAGRAPEPVATPPGGRQGVGAPPEALKPDSQAGVALATARAFGRPFNFGQLVQAAWRRSLVFDLEGIEQELPDSRKVWNTLCGKRGLISRGLVRKCGEGLYEVVR